MTNTTRNEQLPYVDPALADQPELKPSARATCVDCLGVLIAKCGEINRWHWAHEAHDATCTGSDGEGAWHRAWKMWAEQHGAQTEISEGRHRADIVWHDGTVYELQSNYLDAVDIANREQHWGDRLTWIYRITPNRFSRLWNAGDGWFRWQRPPVSMTRHEAPIIWHVNDRLYDATVTFGGNDVLVKFSKGEPDKYGPVLYGSRPAPFDLNDAIGALRHLSTFAKPHTTEPQ